MKKQKIEKKVEEIFRAGRGSRVFADVIRDTERMLIEKALKRAFGNQSIAAKLLGINRNTLRLKIKKLQIDVKKYRI
jgi:DNA-binding protein Fis